MHRNVKRVIVVAGVFVSQSEDLRFGAKDLKSWYSQLLCFCVLGKALIGMPIPLSG